MFVYVSLLVTLLLAFIAARLVYLGMRRGSLAVFFTGLSLAAFVYLYGIWVFLSAYAKYAVVVAVAGCILSGLLYRPKLFRQSIKHAASYWLLCAFLVLLNILYFTGLKGQSEDIELAFPLKGSRYFVLQGGKGLPANVFHFNAHRAVYAMDIVKLDEWGRRSKEIFSKYLDDYYIFADTVYSPCDGIVRRAVRHNPDNIPPARVAGHGSLNGVLIEGSNCYVYLGHFKQQAVFVAAGAQVRTGQPLGLAGNSGMSIEPHLHIQAHKKATDGRPWYDQPQLFMFFSGNAYLLFDIIERPQ